MRFCVPGQHPVWFERPTGNAHGIAFYGIWASADVFQIAINQYILKTLWEVIMTPVTYKVVGFLKRAEQEDYYDRNTRFTPFTLKV